MWVQHSSTIWYQKYLRGSVLYRSKTRVFRTADVHFSRMTVIMIRTKILTAKRPPVEETASFLNSLIASHGPNYLEKLFGSKARSALKKLGGVRSVAIALSRQYHVTKRDPSMCSSIFFFFANSNCDWRK